MKGKSQLEMAVSSGSGHHRSQSMYPKGSQAGTWDFWNTQFVEDFSTWPIYANYSMDADDVVPIGVTTNDMATMSGQTPGHFRGPEEHDPSGSSLPPPVTELSEIWFTKLRSNDEQLLSPSTTIPIGPQLDATEIDEQYRLTLI
jgi:hypothetical protein